MSLFPELQGVPLEAGDNPDVKPAAKRPRGVVRTKLLDAAERLFGQSGVEGVSLREIALAAGQRNVSAVNYYFRDKPGIVDELINDRFAEVEAGRRKLIDEFGDLDNCAIAVLFKFLWQPIIDLCVRRGGNWFIQFHLSYHLHNCREKHPFTTVPDHYPASKKLLAALQLRCSHLPPEQYRYRVGLVFTMLWTAISRYDTDAAGHDWATLNPLTEPIRVGVAAMTAPA